ncbi:MAG: pyrimidine 5'-nucleotidase [Bacillota bacterium]
MRRRYLLFDLDNTLYPEETGLVAYLDRRIEEFLARTLGLERAAAVALRETYRQKYGTTLRGLMENHGLDPRVYFAYVYNVDLGRFLRPDPALATLLDRLPWPKAVFSNSPRQQITRVLTLLGVGDRFERIFGLEFADYLGKPHPEAYRRVLAALGIAGEDCIMVDDSPANLIPARKLGMTTVLLGQEEVPWVDLRVESLFALEEALLGKSVPA